MESHETSCRGGCSRGNSEKMKVSYCSSHRGTVKQYATDPPRLPFLLSWILCTLSTPAYDTRVYIVVYAPLLIRRATLPYMLSRRKPTAVVVPLDLIPAWRYYMSLRWWYVLCIRLVVRLTLTDEIRFIIQTKEVAFIQIPFEWALWRVRSY
jgi:hypothetical protein